MIFLFRVKIDEILGEMLGEMFEVFLLLLVYKTFRIDIFLFLYDTMMG